MKWYKHIVFFLVMTVAAWSAVSLEIQNVDTDAGTLDIYMINDEEVGGFERKIPIEEYNPTEGMERSELRQEIDKAMEKLSYEHRTVLILHEFERMEYREIAKSMQCSIGTVMSRLFYARRKLAKMLICLKKERQE